MALSLPKIPLPAVVQAAFAALFGRITEKDQAIIKALEAAYPGAGGVAQAVIDKYDAPLEKALANVVDIFSSAATEVFNALKTLHAFAKPDPTDGV